MHQSVFEGKCLLGGREWATKDNQDLTFETTDPQMLDVSNVGSRAVLEKGMPSFDMLMATRKKYPTLAIYPNLGNE